MRLALACLALLAVAASSRGGCGKADPSEDPCGGKACGDACTIEPACRSATPPCMVPTLLGHCDPTGQCVAADVSCPAPDPRCAGLACHAPCDPCPPGTACPMMACTTWCDGDGRCTCSGAGAPCP